MSQAATTVTPGTRWNWRTSSCPRLPTPMIPRRSSRSRPAVRLRAGRAAVPTRAAEARNRRRVRPWFMTVLPRQFLLRGGLTANRDGGRYRSVGLAVVAQLSEVVAAPAVDLIRSGQRAGEPGAGGDGLHV